MSTCSTCSLDELKISIPAGIDREWVMHSSCKFNKKKSVFLKKKFIHFLVNGYDFFFLHCFFLFHMQKNTNQQTKNAFAFFF